MVDPAITSAISIHAPAWGATHRLNRRLPERRFQSTHPHGVRLPFSIYIIIHITISIHAPAWGATTLLYIYYNPYYNFNPRTRMGCDESSQGAKTELAVISIHAPAWGATVNFFVHCHNAYYFNPRTRMGCDYRYGRCCFGYCNFNPRTRMGCDSAVNYGDEIAKDFNPRTRMGCDSAPRRKPLVVIIFQSTHPHGVRPRLPITMYYRV